MGNTTNPERWDAQQRLAYIEESAFWRGWIRRSDLADEFGISLPQASADIQAYLLKFPTSLRYDLNAKRYFASDTMRAKLTQPDLRRAISRFLGEESKGSVDGDRVASIDLPQRRIDPNVVRHVFRAAHDDLTLEAHYYSVHSSTAGWRRLSPHAFGHDGYRWHVRAFCHDDNSYKDFVLGRITDAKIPGKRDEALPPDEDWNTWETIRLRPNRRLESTQRRAIEFDYAMRDGTVMVKVRRAMLEYTLSYLRVAKQEFPRQLELVE